MYYNNIKIIDYFNTLKLALAQEKLADKEQFDQLHRKASLQEKRLAGVIWYPVSIKSQEIDAADYITVQFERHGFIDVSHQFRIGGHIALHTQKESYDDSQQLLGTIQYVNDHTMRVKFKTDELPQWTRLGKLSLNLRFDNASYLQMEQAVSLAEKSLDSHELIPIVIGKARPTFTNNQGFISFNNLNQSQATAANQIILADHLAILHGPPGTGKTTTLVEAVKYLANDKKILVTAPSNAAVDLLADKLSESGIEVLRIGNTAKVKESNINNTLEGRMAAHPDNKEIKTLKKQVTEYKNLAHKYKRSFGKAERDQRKALFDEAHKIQKHIESIQQYILEDVLSKTSVTTATLVGSNQYLFQNTTYDIVIIDEAAQALEPACWVPILKAKKVILAGDHFQLPPTIKSINNKELEKTLFEKLINVFPEASTMLNVQYRSNKQIMDFSSEYFYNSALKAYAGNKDIKYQNDSNPLLIIDTSGAGYQEIPDGTSYTNTEEAGFALKFLSSFLEQNSITESQSIAIISPYRAQTIHIESLITDDHNWIKYKPNLRINAVDSFQGQESDIVMISLVRSNAKQEIGFLADIRRMNVAITRARKKCVVIGDSATISTHKFYDQLFKFAEEINSYKTVWDFPEFM